MNQEVVKSGICLKRSFTKLRISLVHNFFVRAMIRVEPRALCIFGGAMPLIQKRITLFTHVEETRGFHCLMRKKILHKVTHFLSWFFFSFIQGSRKTIIEHPHSTPRRARSRHRNAILCWCAIVRNFSRNAGNLLNYSYPFQRRQQNDGGDSF